MSRVMITTKEYFFAGQAEIFYTVLEEERMTDDRKLSDSNCYCNNFTSHQTETQFSQK